MTTTTKNKNLGTECTVIREDDNSVTINLELSEESLNLLADGAGISAEDVTDAMLQEFFLKAFRDVLSPAQEAVSPLPQ